MEETLEKIDLRALIKYAATTIGILSVLLGSFVWIEDRYVNESEYVRHIGSQRDKLLGLENKVGTLISSIEEDRDREYNEIIKEIKDGKIFTLVVQRDILLSRGRENLTATELAELDVLNIKLKELNATP
jgi:hypothetical protein